MNTEQVLEYNTYKSLPICHIDYRRCEDAMQGAMECAQLLVNRYLETKKLPPVKLDYQVEFDRYNNPLREIGQVVLQTEKEEEQG